MSMLASTDPATGETIWRGETADARAVAAALGSARAAFEKWSVRSLDDRIAVAHAFQIGLREASGELAELIARETGKPLWETRTEVQACIAKVDISIAAQAERAGERLQSTATGRQSLRHKPHGVLAVLGSNNFPAHLPNGHIVPALLAGNAVLFKPPEKTPAVGEFLARCWRSAGLPDGVLSVLQGGPKVGRALVEHADIDGVLFTGSAKAGAAIHLAFADTPHRILAI